MTPDKYIVILGGFGLIIFIWWFFFKKTEGSEVREDKIKITVSGGYNPSVVKINVNKEATLSILRTENNSCLEEIVIPHFRINKYLPLNEVVNIKIFPKEMGEFEFHCGMNMYHGKIVVV